MEPHPLVAENQRNPCVQQSQLRSSRRRPTSSLIHLMVARRDPESRPIRLSNPDTLSILRRPDRSPRTPRARPPARLSGRRGPHRPPAATLFRVTPLARQCPMHGRGTAGDARGAGELFQGRVVVDLDRVAESSGGLVVVCGGSSAAARSRGDRAGLPPLPDQLADSRHADREADANLLAGPVAGVTGRDDPLAKVG
jgi:hypothetical protein